MKCYILICQALTLTIFGLMFNSSVLMCTCDRRQIVGRVQVQSLTYECEINVSFQRENCVTFYRKLFKPESNHTLNWKCIDYPPWFAISKPRYIIVAEIYRANMKHNVNLCFVFLSDFSECLSFYSSFGYILISQGTWSSNSKWILWSNSNNNIISDD